MTTYRHCDTVKHIPTGSIGKVNLWMKAGVYLVVFEEADWKGDPGLAKRGKVKMQVNDNDLEAA